ncbi:hypothetical protein HIM_04624 [Hirsutella minnesotensis 3608]|uniref:Uncharacterized protein n=1 Tax=Hirsutella minnesotensis 3608 TaxID=1043627 RepID=A0A0F7ZV84_9HYPO|nr:hypothetical protein HIM_04624 [Hirsutella minnesotensis 3608]
MLKRKRSVSELCSAPSTHASLPPSHTQFSFAVNTSPIAWSGVAQAAHLPSRTMKRFRDGRPSDDEVHQHTLDLLYSAQRRDQQQQPSPVDPCSHVSAPAASAASQQTLHRFWNIDSAPSSAISSPGVVQSAVPEVPSSCQDCGACLREDNGDGGMDLDGFPFDSQTACGACGNHVCFSCSVSNLGEDKRCLQCAGRRVWVGGIGWTNTGEVMC